MEVKEIDLNDEIENLSEKLKILLLNLNIPRDRECLFRPSILPDKWKKEKVDAYRCQIKDEKLQRVRNVTILYSYWF